MKKLIPIFISVIACFMVSSCGYRLVLVPVEESTVTVAEDSYIETTPKVLFEEALTPDLYDGLIPAYDSVTIQFTPENFLEYFSVHAITGYDDFGDEAYFGRIAFQIANSKYINWYPIFSNDFAIELTATFREPNYEYNDDEVVITYTDNYVSEDYTITTSGGGLFLGEEGAIDCVVKRVIGKVVFYPPESYRLTGDFSALYSNHISLDVEIATGVPGEILHTSPPTCLDMIHFAKTNGLLS